MNIFILHVLNIIRDALLERTMERVPSCGFARNKLHIRSL